MNIKTMDKKKRIPGSAFELKSNHGRDIIKSCGFDRKRAYPPVKYYQL